MSESRSEFGKHFKEMGILNIFRCVFLLSAVYLVTDIVYFLAVKYICTPSTLQFVENTFSILSVMREFLWLIVFSQKSVRTEFHATKVTVGGEDPYPEFTLTYITLMIIKILSVLALLFSDDFLDYPLYAEAAQMIFTQLAIIMNFFWLPAAGRYQLKRLLARDREYQQTLEDCEQESERDSDLKEDIELFPQLTEILLHPRAVYALLTGLCIFTTDLLIYFTLHKLDRLAYTHLTCWNYVLIAAAISLFYTAASLIVRARVNKAADRAAKSLH